MSDELRFKEGTSWYLISKLWHDAQWWPHRSLYVWCPRWACVESASYKDGNRLYTDAEVVQYLMQYAATYERMSRKVS